MWLLKHFHCTDQFTGERGSDEDSTAHHPETGREDPDPAGHDGDLYLWGASPPPADRVLGTQLQAHLQDVCYDT